MVFGAWPSGKAQDFGSRIRRFESSRPNHPEGEASMSYDLKLFTGNANRPLAEEIAQYLRVPVADAEVTRFSDGEVYVQVNENVRGADVFVIQPTCPPVNDTLMELLIMIDALKRASAHRITAVLPYSGYARQDRRRRRHEPHRRRRRSRRGGDRRHDRHRRHAGAGGHGHPARGRAAHPGLRRPRRAVGPGHRPHQGLPHRGGRRHQLDRGVAREACGGPGDRADRGAAARRGHSTDPRRGIRLDAIRLDTRTKEPVMNTPEITVKRREGTGKGIARRLRRDGVVPAILYGGAAPETIAVNPRDVLRIIHGREGTTQLLSLKVEGDGGARMAIIRDMQFDPVTERLLHVDIQEVRADRAITVRVAVHPVGEAIGVKDTNGILNLVMHEVEVSTLPINIPERIDADVSNLAIGDVLTVRDLRA